MTNYFIGNNIQNNVQNNSTTIFKLDEVIQPHVRDHTRATSEASDRLSVEEVNEEELGPGLAAPPAAALRQGSAASRTRRMLSVTSE
jgi:hypothetical protein